MQPTLSFGPSAENSPVFIVFSTSDIMFMTYQYHGHTTNKITYNVNPINNTIIVLEKDLYDPKKSWYHTFRGISEKFLWCWLLIFYLNGGFLFLLIAFQRYSSSFREVSTGLPWSTLTNFVLSPKINAEWLVDIVFFGGLLILLQVLNFWEVRF